MVSGSARTGIKTALIETDGELRVRPIAYAERPYTPAARELIAEACRMARRLDAPWPEEAIVEAERVITGLHVGAVQDFLRQNGVDRANIDVAGVDGHTIAHHKSKGWTWQIGGGQIMANELRIPIANNFRKDDLKAGGEGAPILPVYQRYLAMTQERPVAFLHLGGLATLSYVGPDGTTLAFHTGPGSAMVDDWVLARTGQPFDTGGALAALGHVNSMILDDLLNHPYFARPAPKSLDRDEFSTEPVQFMADADGAATLTAFAVSTILRGLDQLPQKPLRLLVSGGGRNNPTMMRWITEGAGCPVEAIDSGGGNGDAVGAQALAYIAVRSMRHLPITYPGSTGVPEPTLCGALNRPWIDE
jgi:anhydro-N-acetylmuramic acid kinase